MKTILVCLGTIMVFLAGCDSRPPVEGVASTNAIPSGSQTNQVGTAVPDATNRTDPYPAR